MFISDLSDVSSLCSLATHLKAVNMVGLSKPALGFIYFLHCFSVLPDSPLPCSLLVPLSTSEGFVHSLSSV